MTEFSERMKERTMAFADAVLRLVDRRPHSPAGRIVAQQLAASATAVAANYRATCNARSRREFVAKLGVVVEEADESACWLELIRNIFAKSVGTARANLRRQSPVKQSTSPPFNRPPNQMTK